MVYDHHCHVENLATCLEEINIVGLVVPNADSHSKLHVPRDGDVALMPYSKIVSVDTKGRRSMPVVANFYNESTSGGKRARQLVRRLWACDFKRYGYSLDEVPPRRTRR